MKLFVNLLSLILFLPENGASGVDKEVSVSVMEGDSVTLYTGVETKKQEDIKWYFTGFLIAEISGDLSFICTDVQCNEGTERFRDRLKLDHQTGSLTIMNITDTHSGVYQLKIISSSDSGNIFNVTVGVSAAEIDGVKRKTVNEGESVTFDAGVNKNPHDLMSWYLNDIVIAEISGDQSKTCTDVQCKERFRDRLKLDHQTGSLTITNINTTDAGEYKLQINNSRFSIMRSFSVSVTAVPDSGSSSAAIIGICAGVVIPLVAGAAAAVIYCHRSKQRNRRMRDDPHQENGVAEAVPLKQRTETSQMDDDNGTSHNDTETPLMATL